MRSRRQEKQEQTQTNDEQLLVSNTTIHHKSKRKKKKDINLFSCLVVLLSMVSYLFYQSALQSFSNGNTLISNDLITPPHPRKVSMESDIDIKQAETIRSTIDLDAFKTMKDKIYNEFYDRYGGKESAMDIYNKGLLTFDTKSLEYTASRILSNLKSSHPFRLSFGGYSVTVGRGNYFHQSYPFVLERTMAPIFESVTIELNVHNGAIGGTPSFPYGWCLRNFMGVMNDFISWDFSMNEGNSASGLEAYIRQGVVMFENPMIMVLDNPKSKGGRIRSDLLLNYVKSNTIGIDSIILNSDFSYIPKELFTKNITGLNEWNEWGAPPGAPGKQSWHLTYQKHELIGWLLSMYFLQSLEVAVEYLFQPKQYARVMQMDKERKESYSTLPPPITVTNALSFLFGTPSPHNSSEYIMNRISCFSSYHPLKYNDLQTTIINGLAMNVSSDILTPTSQDIYTKANGWMHDIGKLERDTKTKLIKFDQLGYIDLKAAYYGIPQSGTLQLSIPLEVDDNEAKTELLRNKFQIENTAKTYIKSILFCQVNEKRTEKECNLEQNLKVVIGDAPAGSIGLPPSKLTTITFPGALYLNKPLCVSADIHEDAMIFVNPKIKVGGNKSLGHLKNLKRGTLSVDIEVVGENVSYENGACSISHVVLEMDSTIFPLQY